MKLVAIDRRRAWNVLSVGVEDGVSSRKRNNEEGVVDRHGK
jgi:hypothetical protein